MSRAKLSPAVLRSSYLKLLPGNLDLLMSSPISNVRPPFDQPIIDIVDYALNYKIESSLAY
jgi:hypothetical protein